MSPSGHTTINLDVDRVDCRRATSNADSSDTVSAHISLQESTPNISRAPNDVNGPLSNTIHHHCSVTQAGLTHCAHADLVGNADSSSITCGMNALYRDLLLLNTIFNLSSVSESANIPDINVFPAYQSDNHRLVTSKLTVEDRSVSDFDNTFAECDENKSPTHDRASTSSERSSTSNARSIYDGTNDIPAYYRFFDSGIEYQVLIDVLALDVVNIVQHPLVWPYTRDFARKTRSLTPDDQAERLLNFIGARSHIPEFTDNLLTVLEARSDLRGFLRKRTQ